MSKGRLEGIFINVIIHLYPFSQMPYVLNQEQEFIRL